MAIAVSERLHDTFFRGKQTPEAGFRYEELFPYTLKLLSMHCSREHHESPPTFYPQTFDEIYAMREQLAAFDICIPRKQATQKAYSAFLKSIDDPEQFVIERKHLGGDSRPNDRRFVILPNDYPSAMPEGVMHLVAWYADNNLPFGWVADKISEYILTEGLTTADFVVYTKPEHSGPAVPGISRSINLPHTHILVRDPKLQTQSEPESM